MQVRSSSGAVDYWRKLRLVSVLSITIVVVVTTPCQPFPSRQGKAVTLYDLLTVNEINLTCQQGRRECHFYAWHTHNLNVVSPTSIFFPRLCSVNIASSRVTFRSNGYNFLALWFIMSTEISSYSLLIALSPCLNLRMNLSWCQMLELFVVYIFIFQPEFYL